ncbi:MAG: VCBS repeat-containing protein [Deltaproteobacteria bacterium]|nr:VCBS repeat-containing protein [Deltaproteobacteria bacterium]
MSNLSQRKKAMMSMKCRASVRTLVSRPATMMTMRRWAGVPSMLMIGAFLLSMTPKRAVADTPPPAAAEPPAPAPAQDPPPAQVLQQSQSTQLPQSQAAAATAAGADTSSDSVSDQAPTTNLPPPKDMTPSVDLQTTALPTGENKSGVSSKAISVPKGPGTIQGMGESFSAQPSTGIATFSVPFALPKARGAAQPSLSLGYSSSSGNGVAGIGWDVSVPYISRQTDRGLPSYQDQETWHAKQDRFVYNGGQELVPICDVPSTCTASVLLDGEAMPTWANGWQYFRPRVEGSYLRFFWHQSENLWRVQDKSGVVLELGGDSNALEADGAKVFRWNLSRQLDAHGNQVKYVYLQNGGASYVQDIYDTPPAAPGADKSNLALWAHHTHLEYETRPDPSTSFNRGWKVVHSLRLARVDVTSVKDADSSTRKLVRRYHLAYDAAYHMSLLDSLQVEGRCPQDVAEGSNGKLPSTSCPRLPAMNFDYSHVGPAAADKFEPFDTTLHHMTGSPKHSVDEQYTDLYDINSDGLPDIVAMMPGTYGGKHGLWLNSDGGNADKFGAQKTIGVKGVLNANESVITKYNANVVALDLDADATINLLHMPKVKTYGIYTPELQGSQWWWVGRAVTTADQLDARIDFGADAAELRVFDVNADGLVDVVKSGGTSWEVWFALGRYPGGDGLFGSATWTGPSTASLSMAPVMRCVPWSATPVRFSDSDTQLADMNGDGLTDIVRLRKGDVKYWPGRGDGTFGTGPIGCAGGTFSQNSFVQMASSPQFSDPNGSALHLDDVNGDGVADLVQVRFDAVDVWHNIDGNSWTDRRILSSTPPSPSYQNRVRLVDMNGSGTRDILWGDGFDYKYIDLAGGKRPWLLTGVANGLGKTTEIAFTTSTEQMLAAEKTTNKWTHKAPMPLHMVKSVTVRDNLGTVGRPSGAYVTEYKYHDPVYDGLQREFRGFSKTEIKSPGDANSPTSLSSSEFILGERPKSFALDCSVVDYTLPSNRWRDNPQEALKGLASISETWDPATGVYQSTGHQSYTLRKLYNGRDGRSTWVAFENRSDSVVYDTSSFGGSAYSVAVPALTLEDKSSTACKPNSTVTADLAYRSSWGTARIRKDVEVDLFGNRLREIAYGNADSTLEDVITSETVPERVLTPLPATAPIPGDGKWSWRTVESYVTSTQDPWARQWHHTFIQYNDFGDPATTQAELVGTVALDRFAPDDGDTAPLPADRSQDGLITTGHTWYDAFGNVILEAGPNGRCREVEYDEQHGFLPIAETSYAGAPTSTTIHGQTLTCGALALETQASYDRGLQAVKLVRGVSNEVTTVDYDGFGRLTQLNPPSPTEAGETSSAPSIKVEYFLPDQTGRPVSMLVTHSQDGANDSVEEYHDSYAFVDGLGRTVVTLSEANQALDGFQWIVQGLTDYDVKGAARRKYLAWGYSGDAVLYNLSAPSPAQYGQQRYDAFGRAVETIGLDGTVTLQTKYHALSADAWDAEDIGPGTHQGTYASEVKDGHGRVVRTTERLRVNGQIEERHTDAVYLPGGEVRQIKRVRGNDVLARDILFDSLGRMVQNQDQNTSYMGRDWRYAYNNAGDLVGTSDARGCGVNFAYDAAGRLLSEDYSPCETHHALYDTAPEVTYFYDEPDTSAPCMVGTQMFTSGKLVSVTDPNSKSISRYDGRGRTMQVARRVNGPDGTPTNQFFCKGTNYDGADRPVRETTGAGSDCAPGTDPDCHPEYSWVGTIYSTRGAVSSVESSYDGAYGGLLTQVKRDADGLVTEIAYGDRAATKTSFDYDDLRRLRNLTTYRQAVPESPPVETRQMLLQDEQYKYDLVGNPVEIRDWRDPSEWVGAPQPVTRKMQYDDLYRLSRIDYEYPGGVDPWQDPYAAEVLDNTRPQPSPRADFTGEKRVMRQTWKYDWLGNISESDDDKHAFYDRSLGTNTHGALNDTGPYQLQSADNTSKTGGRTGHLEAQYDPSGNLIWLDMTRAGPCIPVGKCNRQQFAYQWDEVGRLVKAERWDEARLPGQRADAELHYAYDASNARVRKTVVVDTDERHDVYIFGSLELRLAEWLGTGYDVNDETLVATLTAHGVKLARVVNAADPVLTTKSTRVFLELGDHLGSTSVVLDKATGELVERSTAYAYGAPESDYRPGRWQSFREDYRFTGKEDDIEVGLIYFGARYLNPLLNRWISPDPLAVHSPGTADLNLYAYVHANPLKSVDPAGLISTDDGCARSTNDRTVGLVGDPNPDGGIWMVTGQNIPSMQGEAEQIAKYTPSTGIGENGELTDHAYGVHRKTGGVTPQLERIVKQSGGRLVGRIDNVSHGQQGYDYEPEGQGTGWDLSGETMGSEQKELTTYNVVQVFHGCSIPKNGWNLRDYFKWKPGATLYGHRNSAGPGMPFDWTRVTWNAEKGKVEFRDLRGKDQVVGVVVTKEYVEQWVKANRDKTVGEVFGADPNDKVMSGKNAPRADMKLFDYYFERMGDKITDDVRELMIAK